MTTKTLGFKQRDRGEIAYYGGFSAEQKVARHYETSAGGVTTCRWCGAQGEIDVIVETPDGFVFVEVKKANSWEEAAHRLSASQARRICLAATEYLAAIVGRLDVEMRFDLAMVDRTGAVQIMENAFGFD